MKFLCGRPGCGLESTATLQIDAPSSTVSLVDPRISRDGVPLCSRHADATTPPMGWAMNDLRSRSRPLSAVPDEEVVITSTPPRVRPENEAAVAGQRMSRRQSIADRARRREEEARSTSTAESDGPADDGAAAATGDESDDHRFRSSRRRSAEEATGRGVVGDDTDADEDDDEGVASRPNRRRDVASDEEPEEDKFPWHHQFDDDEPEELQASSPLLSRAFRATIG